MEDEIIDDGPRVELIEIIPCKWIGNIAWVSSENLAKRVVMTKKEYDERLAEQAAAKSSPL